MDDFTAEILASGQDNIPDPPPVENDPTTPPPRTGLRGGFAAFREKASIQDRLVEKLDIY